MGLKKRKVVFTDKAKQSIYDITSYLSHKVSTQTARYVKKEILNKCRSLSDFAGYSSDPYLGYSEKYRSTSKWSYIITYSIDDNNVVIHNIIHSSRHPDRRKDL